jgi:hypothetical protein
MNRSLSAALLDAPMQHYLRRRFAAVSEEELQVRIEETLRFLFISHECTGAIPVSKEVDEVWHAWILQTQEYVALCERLPSGCYVHHSSNDYLSYFDPLVGERDELRQDVKMLALYAANFGPFEEPRATYWLLARHLLQRGGWSLARLNAWLVGDIDRSSQASPITVQSRATEAA